MPLDPPYSPDPFPGLPKSACLESTRIPKEQKQILIKHLKDWLTTLEQQSKSATFPQDALSIIQIGIENQKQHLLLGIDRIEALESKASIIHALQEMSEALGKEAALVGFHISHVGSSAGLNDIITTEIRYHILMDILNLCGGTYLLPPTQEAYFDKIDKDAK